MCSPFPYSNIQPLFSLDSIYIFPFAFARIYTRISALLFLRQFVVSFFCNWNQCDSHFPTRICVFFSLTRICVQVQLGPRYEGQLNPMAEPIPHEVRPLVRTHVYHPYQARTDRQRPIVVFNRRGRVFAPFCGCSLKSRECYNHGPRMASS